jgi:archaellum component FlaF (FlaF/FlaG flagellin family)
LPRRNRRRHGRRGLSTIVTSLLLVVAVAIMGTFVVSWANSSFAAQQLNIANQAADRINLIKEDFVIEDVWFYDSGGKKADITIRNTGDLAVTISKVYVNNTEAWSGDEVITIGSTAKITFNTDWGSGDAQSIWLKTERGSEAKQIWKS